MVGVILRFRIAARTLAKSRYPRPVVSTAHHFICRSRDLRSFGRMSIGRNSRMADIGQHEGAQSRCLFTKLECPLGVKLEQPLGKRIPSSLILGQRFTHTLELLIPKAADRAFRDGCKDGSATLKYAKVHMKLSEVIRGDFFNQYIKSGNVIMLSSGRAGIDSLFYLIDGILHLEIDKSTFERLGLNGKPMSHKGRKHVQARYLVELNLRLPSMVRGKSGFERIVWAFEHVLDQTVTWLFHDRNHSDDGLGPIAIYQPSFRSVEPVFEHLKDVQVPAFPRDLRGEDHLEAEELLEWLSLALLNSPRVRLNDRIDPTLSRYRVPQWQCYEGTEPQISAQDLVRVQWRGLVAPEFALKAFLTAFEVCQNRWMAMNATQFNGDTYTILFTDNHFLTWECKD